VRPMRGLAKLPALRSRPDERSRSCAGKTHSFRAAAEMEKQGLAERLPLEVRTARIGMRSSYGPSRRGGLAPTSLPLCTAGDARALHRSNCQSALREII
jgi:hypothetical protein